jgi:hypothetical protein
MLRIPHCLDNRLTDGGKVCKLYVPAALYSPKTLFIFLLVLISVKRLSKPQGLARLERLAFFIDTFVSLAIPSLQLRLTTSFFSNLDSKLKLN